MDRHSSEIAREGDASDAQRLRQPIAESLKATLREALNVELDEAKRRQLEDSIMAVERSVGPRTGDVSPADAHAFLIGLGLLEANVEPYTVLVAGVKVGVILARNKFHAVNKAKKDFGLTVAEYQWKDRHEIHGARPVAVADPFSRIR
jgi:hypothetical protein